MIFLFKPDHGLLKACGMVNSFFNKSNMTCYIEIGRAHV